MSMYTFNQDEGEESILYNFELCRTIGDYLFNKGHFSKAILFYCDALKTNKNDAYCRIKRAECCLHINQIEIALVDLNHALKLSENNYKALQLKAELHYMRGDFEMALVYFQRCNRLRPKDNFELSIHKCERSIVKAIEVINDFHYLTTKENENFSLAGKKSSKENKTVDVKKSLFTDPPKTIRKPCQLSRVEIRRLLHQEYSEYKYLEKLLKENDDHKNIWVTKPKRIYKGTYKPSIMAAGGVTVTFYLNKSIEVQDHAIECLTLLESRAMLWNMKNPTLPCTEVRNKYNFLVASDPYESYKNIKFHVNRIEIRQSRGDHIGAISHCQLLIKDILKCIETKSPDMMSQADILSYVYSLMGNSYLELKRFKQALECHRSDLDIGRQTLKFHILARAVDNLARTYAIQEDFENAEELFKAKLIKSGSVLESIWLRYSIARCQFKTEHYDSANEMATMALDLATKSDKTVWMIKCLVLIGKSEIKMESATEAKKYFERAMELALKTDNLIFINHLKQVIELVKKLLIKEEEDSKLTKTDVTSKESSSDEMEDEYEAMKMRNLYMNIVQVRNKTHGRTMIGGPMPPTQQ